MSHNIQFRYLGVILLLLVSSGMTSVMAGNAALVLPGQLLRPTINVTPRQARQYHYQAVTRAPVRKRGRVRAGTLAWQCQGTACTISGPWPTPAVGACRTLAKQVGAIQSYGHASRKLSAPQLRQCNAGITALVRKPLKKQIRQTIARSAIKTLLRRAQIAPVVTRSGHPPAGLSTPRVPSATRSAKPAIAVAPVISPVRSSSHRPTPRLRMPVTAPKANPINRPTGLAVGRQARKFTPPPAPHTLQPKETSANGGFALPPRSGVRVSGLNKPVTGRGGKSLLPAGIPRTAKPISGGGGFALAPKPVFGLGSGRPVAGRDGKPLIGVQALPKIKLIFDHIEDRHGQRLDSVIPGNSVHVFFRIQYTGSVMYTIYVRGQEGEGRTNDLILPANNPVLSLVVRVKRNIPWTGDNWNPVFMVKINSIVRNSSGRGNHPGPQVHSRDQRDEVATVAARIRWRSDLEVVAVKRVTLNMQWTAGSGSRIPWFRYASKPMNKWKGTGVNYPVSISMVVAVRNLDVESSMSGRKLTVTLTGLRKYSPVRHNRHYPVSLLYRGDECRSAGCPVKVTVSVPPMPGYGQKDVRVVLQNLPFATWTDNKAGKRGAMPGYHMQRASGYFMCGDNGHGHGSRIRIDATVNTSGDSRSSNNAMMQRLTFGGNGGRSCSGTND